MTPRSYIEEELKLFPAEPDYLIRKLNLETRDLPYDKLFDNLASQHDGYILRESKMDVAKTIAYLERWISGERVVDAGCATGIYLGYLAQVMNATFIGYDISPRMIACAQQRKRRLSLDNMTVFVMSHDKLPTTPLEENSVDCVYALFSLPQFSHALNAFERILRRKCRLIIDLHKGRHDMSLREQRLLLSHSFCQLDETTFPLYSLATFEKLS